MRKTAKLAIGAVMALSASTAAAAQVAPKSNSSCYDAYGHYGYSAGYCEHNMYGRSSPADRFYGQNSDTASRDGQNFGRQGRELYSYLYRGYATPDHDDYTHYPDRAVDRDRG